MERVLWLKFATGGLLAVVAATSLALPLTAQSPADGRPTDISLSKPLSWETASDPLATPVNVCPCPQEEAKAPAPDPYGGPFCERSKLTGDWLGARSKLRDEGITFNVSTTQFYQGVASGGLSQAALYGGRNDYFMNFDGEKLGLWKGLGLTLHGETRYGDSPNFITGALSPVNEMLLVPQEHGTVTALTAVKFTQQVTDHLSFYAGKVNLLDAVVQPLTGATPLEGFQNTSLIFNTILARVLPYSTFGAGMVYTQDDGSEFFFSVYDANNTPTTTGFESFFNSGILLFSGINIATNFFGMPGHQGLQGAYSSSSYTNTQFSSYLDPYENLIVNTTTKTGSWALAYNVDQALWSCPDDPKKGWGVFGKLGIADNNPNPIQWTAMAGISGSSPLAGREKDTFGVGYFYLGVSGQLKDSANPITPLRNEQGVEMYYNARVTPWFQLTPDFQVIVPFEQGINTVLVLGLRAKIAF